MGALVRSPAFGLTLSHYRTYVFKNSIKEEKQANKHEVIVIKMQSNLPIAVCLLKAHACEEHALSLCVHQVVPERRRSLLEFVRRSCASLQGGQGGKLLHHVMFFTPLSYAECQSAVRRFVASRSGARVVGRSRVLVGDEGEIAKAMTDLSLDSTALDDLLFSQRPWVSHESDVAMEDDYSSSSEGSFSDDSFIEDDDEEAASEASEDDPDDQTAAEDDDEGCGSRPTLRRLRRMDDVTSLDRIKPNSQQ